MSARDEFPATIHREWQENDACPEMLIERLDWYAVCDEIDDLRANRSPVLSPPVGVDYCVVHCGIRNEDEETCDFAGHRRDDDEQECDCRPLVYVVQS